MRSFTTISPSAGKSHASSKFSQNLRKSINPSVQQNWFVIYLLFFVSLYIRKPSVYARLFRYVFRQEQAPALRTILSGGRVWYRLIRHEPADRATFPHRGRLRASIARPYDAILSGEYEFVSNLIRPLRGHLPLKVNCPKGKRGWPGPSIRGRLLSYRLVEYGTPLIRLAFGKPPSPEGEGFLSYRV